MTEIHSRELTEAGSR